MIKYRLKQWFDSYPDGYAYGGRLFDTREEVNEAWMKLPNRYKVSQTIEEVEVNDD
jgi:hypothetical protein